MICLISHHKGMHFPLKGRLSLLELSIDKKTAITVIMCTQDKWINDVAFVYNYEQLTGRDVYPVYICDLNKIEAYLFSDIEAVRNAAKEVIEQLPKAINTVYKSFEVWRELK